MKKCIAIIDSGIGGLHILKECKQILPNYNFVYIADTFNAPYGNKTQHKLKQIANNLVEFVIKKYSPEIIVIACNTLTVNTIKFLRKKFVDVKFVGVEPALKQAKIYGGDTIIFATPRTLKAYSKLNKKITLQLKQEYFKLGLKYANKDKVYKISHPTLAKMIDDNCDNLDSLMPVLDNLFNKEKYHDCLNIVLGCTHYIAIKEQLNELFSNIKFFDGKMAVAKRVTQCAKFAQENNKSDGKITFMTTDGNNAKLNKIKRYYFTL